MKYATVTFLEGFSTCTPYDYYIPDHFGVETGNICVVDVSGVFKCVKVKSVHCGAGKATKYLVDVVDLTQYNEHKEKVKRKAALLMQLAKLQKEIDETQRFAYLASVNPEARRLLEELQTI